MKTQAPLIVSFLLGIPIESLLFEEADNEGYNVLDGKQRTLTLCAYVADEFGLSYKIRQKELDGEALVGKKFSDLPEEMQNRIMDYELSISVLRPLEESERAIVFFMRNQAASLSKMDLSRVLLGEHHLSILQAVCEHPFLRNKIKLTEPARRKNEDLLILLQYLLLTVRKEPGFSGNEVLALCDDINSGEVEISGAAIVAILSYLDQAIPEKRQFLKKVHIPVVMYTAQQAMEQKLNSDDYGKRIDAFFEHLEPDGEYMAACKSGSAKRTNVQFRVDYMGKILNTGKMKK